MAEEEEDVSLPEETTQYLKRKEPIPEGGKRGRHNQLLIAACRLNDAKYPIAVSETILFECAVKRDGLPEDEFKKVVHWAYNQPSHRHRYLGRTKPEYIGGNGNGQNQKLKKKSHQYSLNPKTELPEPIDINDAAIKFLESVFKPGESVCIVKGKINNKGEKAITSGGDVLTRESWIEKFKSGTLNLWNGERGLGGVFVRINPTQGIKDSDVTDHRHALIEFDTGLTKQEQYDLIKKSNIPCACILDSGKRSIHAWVIVAAKSRQEYDERVKFLYDHFGHYDLDEANKNPSRFSRLPGGMRVDVDFNKGEGGEQHLLELKTGAKSWGSWVEHLDPKNRIELITATNLRTQYPKLKQAVIHDILRVGETVNFIASPKLGKSTLIMDLAISVSLGQPWLGFHTVKNKVLIIDNELHKETLSHRLGQVAAAKKVVLEAFGDLITFIPLRGKLKDIFALEDILEDLLESGEQFGLVVLDSLYRFYPQKFDENNNADMAKLYNTIDSYAAMLNAAFVPVHHMSRGVQYGKNVTDRGAGAGAQSRACDSHLTLTPHPDEDDVFVIEAAVRSWKPIKPFCIKKDYPLLIPAPDIEVPEKDSGGSGGARGFNQSRKITYTAKKGEKYADIKAAVASANAPFTRKDFVALVHNVMGGTRRNALNHIKSMLDDPTTGLMETGLGTDEDPKMYSIRA